MITAPPPLTWLAPGEDFPALTRALGKASSAPGLLAAGGALDTSTLCKAYASCIFPWFSEGQPILWWSPDPRMVLKVSDFRLHHSLKKTLKKYQRASRFEVKVDTAFELVIRACSAPRASAHGTWISPEMITAYEGMYQSGFAHSIETWVDGELVGGLYCIAIGKAVFGESMFSRTTDASKIALAALVAFCLAHDIEQIDCQQNTNHLASLGAKEISRDAFEMQVANDVKREQPTWRFENIYWQNLQRTM